MEIQIKRLGSISRTICRIKGYEGLSVPVFVRWCNTHHRFEWCDPFSEKGGVAKTISSLISSLISHYKCGNCGFYHVYDVFILNIYKKVSFVSFIWGDYNELLTNIQNLKNTV